MNTPTDSRKALNFAMNGDEIIGHAGLKYADA